MRTTYLEIIEFLIQDYQVTFTVFLSRNDENDFIINVKLASMPFFISWNDTKKNGVISDTTGQEIRKFDTFFLFRCGINRIKKIQ